jgi:hypothetical protein
MHTHKNTEPQAQDLSTSRRPGPGGSYAHGKTNSETMNQRPMSEFMGGRRMSLGMFAGGELDGDLFTGCAFDTVDLQGLFPGDREPDDLVRMLQVLACVYVPA